MSGEPPPEERRRDDRRSDHVRLADFTIPEVRKAVISGVLLTAVFVLFAYMVADVLVAVIAGIVLGAYLIPFDRWLGRVLRKRALSAIVTITIVIAPLLAILTYSWAEISDTAEYLEENRRFVAGRMTAAVQQIPFVRRIVVEDDLSRWVAAAANQSTRFVGELREALGIIVISIAVFLVTVFYVLVEHRGVLDYIRARIPGRYRDLQTAIGSNISAVVYGALYATFITQILKSGVVLSMNLIWDVPLAFVLAIASFFIGFFPIVGSWAVYVPVGLYLAVFREDPVAGAAVVTIGFVVNTTLLSMYLRPKLAAEKSHVLSFYWMFIALVTGVYTFGLIGIIIGPVLIGVLKAVFETVAGGSAPLFLDGGTAELDDPVRR